MEGKANYLTLKEAAEQLGVHPNTLRNWERRGVDPAGTAAGQPVSPRAGLRSAARRARVDAACAAGRRTGFLAGRLACAD